jgi:hyperosmotically inducible protein
MTGLTDQHQNSIVRGHTEVYGLFFQNFYIGRAGGSGQTPTNQGDAMYKKLLLFAFAAMIFSVSAQTAPGQNNSRLDRQIRKEILTLPYYGVFDAIGYQLNGDTVTLNGYVVRPTTKRDAENAVADVDGVGRVVNNIQVLPLSPSDDRIRYRLLRTLTNTGGLYRYFLGANPGIRIIVNRGRVSLEGYVDTRGDSNLAYVTARGVPGTFAVTNNLRVLAEPR